MFEIKNGVLFKDGVPQLCLGLSYYPSYHPRKHPVRPEDDRIGELKKDIHEMAAAGFNLVRFAALGDLRRVGPGEEGVEVSFPLIDECMKATERENIAAQVRLQGYTLNVSGYTGEGMITAEGRELGQYECFLRACLNHEGIFHDNEDCTAASAKHFMKYKTLVSYQIFNEPHYRNGVDYNPHSIAAWRKWLVEKGLKTAEEAEHLEPPRRRPIMTMDFRCGKSEDYHDWMNWRLFHYEKLNWYLVHMDQVARRVNPHAENMTCHMNCPITPGVMTLGEDYFRTAEGMEVLGITHYIDCFGENFYWATQVLDATESAAAVFGKHAWLVEYNARTSMPANEWDRETYAAVGGGFKGIIYYQWRADYPYIDAPEPDEFGILFNDRTKTAAYDHAIRMNRLINDKLSEKIARAEKLRGGVAVLYSEKANAYCDATEGSNAHISDGMRMSYRHFRKAGMPVDFVRACDLEKNPLGVRLLIMPAANRYYPAEELQQIAAFQAAGGKVYQYMDNDGFTEAYFGEGHLRWQETPDGKGGFTYGLMPVKRFGVDKKQYVLHGVLQAVDSAEEVLEAVGIAPIFTAKGARRLDARVLTGPGYYLVCLTNIDTRERSVPAGQTISLSIGQETKQAILYSPDQEEICPIEVKDGRLLVTLPEIRQGGFLLLRAN